MSARHWLVFAGGGTGGHLFPALAVVDALRRRDEPVDVSFFCTQRPMDREILSAERVEAFPLTVQPYPRRPWDWPGFWLKWRESVRRCTRAFRQRRPAAVVGAGGYASGPPVRVAMRLGIPTFLLNPDAIPGRANQHLARKKGLSGAFVQWMVTRNHFPPAVPVKVTGCPVRPAFARRAQKPRCTDGGVKDEIERRETLAGFGLQPARRTVLITGASQGARTINEAMMTLAPQVAATGWQVLHLSGEADQERIRRVYSQAGVPGVVLPFTDRMADGMWASDLIVSRAGASSLAEILALGRPSILLPYPYHRDHHQRQNGAVLVEAGAAVMLEDLKDASANARQMGPVLLALMSDDARRAEMASAARQLGRPKAAQAVAEHLLEAASRNGGTGCEIPGLQGAKILSRRTA